MSSTPESRGPAIVKVAIISPVVASLFVFLRLYTRAFLAKSLGWDDLVAFLTLWSSVAYSVLISIATYNGMGMHQYDLSYYENGQYHKWIAISSELYLLSLMGYKLAILMTYHRIFSVSQRFRYVCWAVMFVTVGYLFSNMITEVAGCRPLEKFLYPETPGHCITFLAADIAYGALNVITDFAIALLPVRMVWRLQINRREKIGLWLVLSSGIVAFVVALIRWIIGCVDLTATDSSWIAGLTFLWSVLEVNTGLICACCLPLKPLLNVARDSPLLSKILGGSSRKASTTRNTTFAEFEKRKMWLGQGRKMSGASAALPVLDSLDREMRGASVV